MEFLLGVVLVISGTAAFLMLVAAVKEVRERGFSLSAITSAYVGVGLWTIYLLLLARIVTDWLVGGT